MYQMLSKTSVWEMPYLAKMSRGDPLAKYLSAQARQRSVAISPFGIAYRFDAICTAGQYAQPAAHTVCTASHKIIWVAR
jgi:hypothetical protein